MDTSPNTNACDHDDSPCGAQGDNAGDIINKLDGEVREMARKSFVLIARSSNAQVTNNKWLAAATKVQAASAAKELRDAARLKALQRTPYPMVLQRIKILLDKVHDFDALSTISSGTSSPHRPLSPTSPFGRSGKMSGTAKSPGSFRSMASSHSSFKYEDKVVSELCIIFSYVSEFLRKVPHEVRASMCDVCQLESVKKDSLVVREGEEPDRLFIVLTGALEMWVHPPGNRYARKVVSTLRKGQAFADIAILNNEPLNTNVTAVTACTFLTVARPDFTQIFGAWFQEEHRLTVEFFKEMVPPISRCPDAQISHLARRVMRSSYAAGTDWEPAYQDSLIFLLSGTCLLESIDKKFLNQPITKANADPTIPTLANTGVLANVEVHHGRAVGTLGKEAELKRLRAAFVPKKKLAVMEMGAYFGGGVRVMGDGELQQSLKVVSTTAIEVYEVMLEEVLKYTGPEALGYLRDDMAFRMTYFYGKVGVVGMDAIVGHPENHLLGRKAAEEAAELSATRGKMGKAKRPKGKPPKVEFQRDPGHRQYSPYTQMVITHYEEVQECMKQRVNDAVYCFGTPAERYHKASNVVGGQVGGVLSVIYPDGLQPLAEKVDDLFAKAHRHQLQAQSRPSTSPEGFHNRSSVHNPSPDSPSGSHHIPTVQELSSTTNVITITGGHITQLLPTHTAADLPITVSPYTQPLSSTIRNDIWDFSPSSPFPSPLNDLLDIPCRPSTSPYPGSKTMHSTRNFTRPGGLVAAGKMWETVSATGSSAVPPLRQCLTYEEISRSKTEIQKELHKELHSPGKQGGHRASVVLGEEEPLRG